MLGLSSGGAAVPVHPPPRRRPTRARINALRHTYQSEVWQNPDGALTPVAVMGDRRLSAIYTLLHLDYQHTEERPSLGTSRRLRHLYWWLTVIEDELFCRGLPTYDRAYPVQSPVQAYRQGVYGYV